MQRNEILPGELCRYASELKAAVEAICSSPPFRTSAKSCQFLRHIVQLTLEGNVDELKERLIGIVLLGRETSYDTGSDAGVRVRANDVRKRLAAYYAAHSGDLNFTLELPAGSYAPRFYMLCNSHDTQHEAELPVTAEPYQSPAVLPETQQLSPQLLALPTLVALFLCVICIRWQLTREYPFESFWNSVFQDHHALLYVPDSNSGGHQGVVPADTLEDTASLFNLAGQFHSGIALTRTLDLPAGANDILILIGTAPASSHDGASDQVALQDISLAKDVRLVIDASPSGRRIVDRDAANPHLNSFGHAALLTIANGAQRSIQIDGTDAAAINSLIKAICLPDAFPAELIDSFQQGTVTQIVFPMQPHTQAVVFHESLPLTHSAMNGPL
jgi:hypothetical protein